MFAYATSKSFYPTSFSPSTGVSTSNDSDSPHEDPYEFNETFHPSSNHLPKDNEEVSLEIEFFSFLGFFKSFFLKSSVKPKRKIFNTREEKRRYVQEYKKKVKTELCKNWQLKGSCKYAEKCCFAHGEQELKEKVHLHSNYKTKPCKQYFYFGSCPYGYRCQYMHDEIKQSPEKTKEFVEFLRKAYEEKGMLANFFAKKDFSYCFRLKKIENILTLQENKEIFPIKMSKRLPVFKKISFFTNPSLMELPRSLGVGQR